MKKCNQNSSFLVFYALGLLSAFFVFLICHIPLSTFFSNLSYQVDVASLFSLLATSVFGFYFTVILNKKQAINKVENDLLIDYFDKFQKDFGDVIHSMVSSDKVELSTVTSFFKKNSMYMQELVDLIGIKIDPKKLDDVQLSINDLRGLFSDIPRDGDVEDGIRVSGGYLVYSQKQKEKMIDGIRKFRKSVFLVITLINRS
ncbi:MAG: hypothetical protein WC472_02145 [Candidatus Paceibacterota bacterium]